MKVAIETGSESHTTSSARLQAEFVGGPYDGEYLYKVKKFIVSSEWEKAHGGSWVTTLYELPEMTTFKVSGVGRTGPRGVNEHAVSRVYRVDSEADVIEVDLDLGLRTCKLKGRLVLETDYVELANKKPSILEGEF